MARIDMPEGANVAVPGTYSLIQAAMSNKGNPTSQGFNNLMLVEQDQPVRIVDKTGEVLFEGTGPEAARQAVVIGQDLTNTMGKKAGWDIQTVPVGTSNFKTIANEKVDTNVLGTIADIGLPILASALIPGGGLLGTILPAAAGSAASSVAQGRSLENTLLRAAMAGGGAGLGEKFLSPAINAALKPATAAVTQAGTNAAVQAATQAAGDGLSTIIVNGIPQLVSTAGSAIGSALASGLSGAASGLTGSQPTAPSNMGEDIFVTAAQNTVPNVGSIAGGVTSLLTPPSTPTVGDEIFVTAKDQPGLNLGGSIGALPLTPTPPVNTPPTVGDEIIVNAPTDTPPFAPPIFVPPGILPPSTPPTAPPEAPTDTTPPGDKKDVLGTGLTASELALIGSLGTSVIGSLFGGGGGGTGPTTPYVSPFGGGTGFGTGMDYRAQPAIADYERYGFGPEATFFRPEYNRLISAAAPAPAATTTPTYQPLI
jgi:hypothetical protein